MCMYKLMCEKNKGKRRKEKELMSAWSHNMVVNEEHDIKLYDPFNEQHNEVI